MLAAPILLALVLPLARQCLARTIEVTNDVDAQKRDVNFLQCVDLWDEDVVHITKWTKEQANEETTQLGSDLLHPRSELTHMLDSRDLQPDMITQDLLEKRQQEITAQDPIYLGLTGEKDKHGNDILGQVNSMDNAPSFQFLVCPANDFMNYPPSSTSQGLEIVYGHLAFSSDSTKCVMPTSLKKRNAPLVLKPCPTSEDGKQIEAYFKFTRYERLDKGITTILRYMEFVGKPNRSVPNHFQANYTIRFEQSSKSVYVDGRHPNEKKGKGEHSVFSFNNRRKAK